MKILEINSDDLIGRIYNGYDLHLALIEKGMDAKQLVLDKRSNEDTVICLDVDEVIRRDIAHIERKMAISNVLFPYAELLKDLAEFKEADIIHYHFTFHQMFSLLDYPKIMNKNTVWTIHDPWVTTGNCTHPLECNKWLTECADCPRLDDEYFPMDADNVNFMWQLKKKIFAQMNPNIIVASNWMKEKLNNSPLTRHFDRIHLIPFGVEETDEVDDKEAKRHDRLVIGFRAEDGRLKGCSFLYEALRNMPGKDSFEIVTVGRGNIPQEICDSYRIMEYGYVEDRKKVRKILSGCDIFVMPSLAESFGLMAIEAMSCGCVVLCFKGTVLEEITNAPDCGIAVEYMSATALKDMLVWLSKNLDEMRLRQKKGLEYVRTKYSMQQYVDKHIELFQQMLNN